MIEIKVRRVGSSLGVLLPVEATTLLGVKENDKLFLTETPDGYRITRYDPEFKEQVEAAEEFMDDYGDALKELGDS